MTLTVGIQVLLNNPSDRKVEVHMEDFVTEENGIGHWRRRDDVLATLERGKDVIHHVWATRRLVIEEKE